MKACMPASNQLTSKKIMVIKGKDKVSNKITGTKNFFFVKL